MHHFLQFVGAMATVRPLGCVIAALAFKGPGLDLRVDTIARQCATGFFKRNVFVLVDDEDVLSKA